MIVDISGFNDRCVKSFLFYLITFFQPYSIDNSKNQRLVERILRDKIPMGEELYNYLMRDITNINNISKLVDNNGKEYIIKKKNDIYNYSLGVFSFENMDELINLINVIGNTVIIEEENLIYLQGLQEVITFWNYGINFIEGKRFYELNGFYPEIKDLINGYLQSQIRSFKSMFSIFYNSAVEIHVFDKYKKTINNYKRMVKDEIKSKSLTIRFVLACLAFLDSPFYSDDEKKLIEIIYNQTREILVNCDIHNIYLEQSVFYNSEIPDEEKGSKDKTTRIQMIFSLENDDIYSLRFDMPHKGVDYIHLNMEEVKDGKVFCSALPITERKEVFLVKKICGTKEKNFFIDYGNMWFKKDFTNSVERSILEENNKTYLLDLYKRNSHYRIDIKNGVDYYGIFNEFSKFLKVYNEDSIVMPTEKVDIALMIYKARIKKWLRDYWEITILKVISGVDIHDHTKRAKENIIHILFDELRYQEFSRSDMEELDFPDIIDMISEYINY
ncbi:hypothetical protein ABFV83_00095 [Lacrimispora sp. BS-2]|uniref:Uncharacterized protein n=1 Tax=Lacrimispora sp. BS-2 TaxID=3151850 RepID=A0AAU7PPR0_9FIRM